MTDRLSPPHALPHSDGLHVDFHRLPCLARLFPVFLYLTLPCLFPAFYLPRPAFSPSYLILPAPPYLSLPTLVLTFFPTLHSVMASDALRLDHWTFSDSPPILLSFSFSPDPPTSPSPSPSPVGALKSHLWAWYLYSNGANGAGPLRWSLEVVGAHLAAAAFDGPSGHRLPCDPLAPARCSILPLGTTHPAWRVHSVLFAAAGLALGGSTLVLVPLGALLDAATRPRAVLFGLSVVLWTSQAFFLSVTGPGNWKAALGLYVVGLIAYVATAVFSAAALCQLSRRTSSGTRHGDLSGTSAALSHPTALGLERSWLATMRGVHVNVGYVICALLSLAVTVPVSSGPRKNSYAVMLCTAYSVLLGSWWLIGDHHHPTHLGGSPLGQPGWRGPEGLWNTFKACKTPSHTLIYLLSLLLLSFGVSTMEASVLLAQSEKSLQFSSLQITYSSASKAVVSMASMSAWWWLQSRLNLTSKQMLLGSSMVSILISLWGTLGLLTNASGFHHRWEFWTYHLVLGGFQAPFYSYSVALMAELSPPGHEHLFFGLYGLSMEAGAFFGMALIELLRTQHFSKWAVFPALALGCLGGTAVLGLGVDIDRGGMEALDWHTNKKHAPYTKSSSPDPDK